MVKIEVKQVKQPVAAASTSTGGRVPISVKEKQPVVSQPVHSVTSVFEGRPPLPGETQAAYDRRVFGESISPAPSSTPGIIVKDDLTTKVTLGPGEGSRLQWEQGTPVIKDNVTTTPYTFSGTITPARKTEGIIPLKDVTPSTYDVLKTTVGVVAGVDFKKTKETGKGISQTAADLFGVSGQQSQELFAPVDVYGDKGYRGKLLAEGIAEQGPSAKDIGTFLVQTPGYVGMGSGLSGIGGVLKGAAAAKGASGAAVAGHGLFTYGLITSGATMGAVTAADIFTTESKTMKEWKLFQTGAAIGLMAYGAKPSGSVGKALQRLEQHQYQAMASDLNMRLGGPAEYGMYRVGKPGIKIASSSQLKVEPIINKYGFKIGEQYTRGMETTFKPGDTTLIFDKPTSPAFGKQFKMTNVGYSEAMNIMAPGVEKPITTNLFTKVKFRTGETKGLITSGEMTKYTKLQPDYTPYVDTGKPFGFEGTPLKFEKPPMMTTPKITPTTVKTTSPVTGASARGLFTEFVQPLTKTDQRIIFSETMQTPVFNVYPPGSQAPLFVPITKPIEITGFKTETPTGTGTREAMNMFKVNIKGFKTDIKMDVKPDTRQDPWSDTIQRNIQRTGDITIPTVKVTPDIGQRQDKIIEFTQDYPFEFPFKTPYETPPYRPQKTTPVTPPGGPLIPPMNLGETGKKGFEDWLFGIRRERKHKVSDPFKALKEFKL